MAAVFFAALVALSGCGKGSGPSSDAAKTAPDFALKDLSGKTLTLRELRGKTVLIDFWATWCGPCAEAIPFYEKIYEKYEGKPFAVLGIDEDGMTDVVAPFAKKKGIRYPILLDADNKAFDAFGVRGLPTAFLVDSEGNIRDKWIGFDAGVESEIEKAVGALLEAKK
ncbi:MAG: TlpA family protein disulfide reductase [Elusimicrobia bacterium]|nr:TlpA family protein disulfide reductase [Elusimicrobiota bacterium]